MNQKNHTMNISRLFAVIIIVLSHFFSIHAYADEPVGHVAKVKNSVYVTRNNSRIPAKPLNPLSIKDIVETGIKSRAKLSFSDGSILNMGESSVLKVKAYHYDSLRKRSRSLYDLIDGTLKTTVGRSDLKIHTRTAVCAARGTEFILWIEKDGGSALTGIIMIEGETTVKNIDKNIRGTVTVHAGEMTRIIEGQPPGKAVPADIRLLNSLNQLIVESMPPASGSGKSTVTGTVINESDISGSSNTAIGQDSEANTGSVIMK